MVDVEVLRRRIDALLGYLGRLEAFDADDRERFPWDAIRHDLGDLRRFAHIAASKL